MARQSIAPSPRLRRSSTRARWPPADSNCSSEKGPKLVNYWPFPKTCAVIETLQSLKKHGQRLDTEIAKETGVPLATVRQHLSALADSREAIVCNLIRFENGKKIEAWQCRVSGFIPPATPGRKAKPKT